MTTTFHTLENCSPGSNRSILAQAERAKAEELKAAYDRIVKLEAILEECLEYFEDRYDVVDGSYGEPAPNREMSIGTTIDEALNGRPF